MSIVCFLPIQTPLSTAALAHPKILAWRLYTYRSTSDMHSTCARSEDNFLSHAVYNASESFITYVRSCVINGGSRILASGSFTLSPLSYPRIHSAVKQRLFSSTLHLWCHYDSTHTHKYIRPSLLPFPVWSSLDPIQPNVSAVSVLAISIMLITFLQIFSMLLVFHCSPQANGSQSINVFLYLPLALLPSIVDLRLNLYQTLQCVAISE